MEKHRKEGVVWSVGRTKGLTTHVEIGFRLLHPYHMGN